MQTRTRNRIKLAAVLLLAVVPISLASWLFNRAAQSPGGLFGTVNNGQLIQPPADVTALDMRDENGELIFRSFEERIAGIENSDDYDPDPWLLVLVNTGDCGDPCMDRVHMLRQMHATLAEDASRVRRYYLQADDRPLSDARRQVFREDYPSMGLARGRLERIERALTEAGVAVALTSEPHVFLVDPVGNVMMYYTGDHGIDAIHEDLERLLEYSSLG